MEKFLEVKTVLKSDHYPGSQNLSLPEKVLGAPNFREIPGFPVYGVANPTIDGIRAIVRRIGSIKGGRPVFWHHMREEPAIYINGKPFVLREVERPYKNMLEYTGMDSERVERMEARLKEDILREAERYGGAIMDGSLASKFPSITLPPNQKLHSLWDGAQWVIPPDLLDAVAASIQSATQHHFLDMQSKDSLLWSSHQDQGLTLKEAWQIIRTRRQSDEWSRWDPLVWNFIQQPRVSFFAWRMLHGKTPTQAWAKHIGFNLASRCNLCLQDQESSLHLFFLCPFSSDIWNWILSKAGMVVAAPLLPSKIWHALSLHSDPLACKEQFQFQQQAIINRGVIFHGLDCFLAGGCDSGEGICVTPSSIEFFY